MLATKCDGHGGSLDVTVPGFETELRSLVHSPKIHIAFHRHGQIMSIGSLLFMNFVRHKPSLQTVNCDHASSRSVRHLSQCHTYQEYSGFRFIFSSSKAQAALGSDPVTPTRAEPGGPPPGPPPADRLSSNLLRTAAAWARPCDSKGG